MAEDKILLGHTCQQNAFYVSDYPYGFRLRCRIRYWIETAEKGAKKGEMRFVSQTTNPKAKLICKGHEPGPNEPMGIAVYCDGSCRGEVWNKPNAGVYCELLVMVQRGDNNHVETRGISPWSGPEQIEAFKALPVQADPTNALQVECAAVIRGKTNALERLSRHCNKDAWEKFDKEKAKASGYVTDATV